MTEPGSVLTEPLIVALSRPLSDSARTMVRTRLLGLSDRVTDVDESGTAVLVHHSGVSNAVAEEIRREVSQIATRDRADDHEPIHRHTGRPPVLSRHEVHERLRATGELFELDPGHLGYAGRLLQLIRALDRRFQQLAMTFGAQEISLPGTMSLAAARRSGYLGRFPQHACFAVNLGQDTYALDAVAEAATEPEPTLTSALRPAMDLPGHMVAPLLCFGVYEHLAGRRLADDEALTYTVSGRCRRNEQSPQPAGLARLTEFTMREVVFVGSPDAVADGCERLVAATGDIAEKYGLTFTIAVATDPFFRIEDVRMGVLQRLAGLKRELRAELDRPDAPIALSSFNLHGDLFGRRYDISGRSGPVSTACVGWGLERWALAALCQRGLDPSAWELIDG